jgi:hypothetical protein
MSQLIHVDPVGRRHDRRGGVASRKWRTTALCQGHKYFKIIVEADKHCSSPAGVGNTPWVPPAEVTTRDSADNPNPDPATARASSSYKPGLMAPSLCCSRLPAAPRILDPRPSEARSRTSYLEANRAELGRRMGGCRGPDCVSRAKELLIRRLPGIRSARVPRRASLGTLHFQGLKALESGGPSLARRGSAIIRRFRNGRLDWRGSYPGSRR